MEYMVVDVSVTGVVLFLYGGDSSISNGKYYAVVARIPDGAGGHDEVQLDIVPLISYTNAATVVVYAEKICLADLLSHCTAGTPKNPEVSHLPMH